MEKILKMLRAGQLVLAPTDTIWGILCDATNSEAVKKVYELKKRPDSKAMVCMVSDFNMLKNHINEWPVNLADFIDNPRPTTVIYNNPVGIAKNAITPERTVAIRIVNHHFCTPLISAFGKPLISTSANISGTPHPKNFSDIANEILKGVDHIVEMDQDNTHSEPSRIIKIQPTGDITLIRA